MTTPWWGSLDKMSVSLVCGSYVRNSNQDDWIIDPTWSKLYDSITHPLCHSLYRLQMHMSKCMYIDQCMYWLFSSRDVVVLLIHKLHNFTVWTPSWSWHNHHGLYLYRGLNKLICFLRKCPPIYWEAYLSTRTCFHGLSSSSTILYKHLLNNAWFIILRVWSPQPPFPLDFANWSPIHEVVF